MTKAIIGVKEAIQTGKLMPISLYTSIPFVLSPQSITPHPATIIAIIFLNIVFINFIFDTFGAIKPYLQADQQSVVHL